MRLTGRGYAVAFALLVALLGAVTPSRPAVSSASKQAEELRPQLEPAPRQTIRAEPRASRSGNKSLAKFVLKQEGFGPEQWPCLDRLWHRESRWLHDAINAHSGAYGIPQRMGVIPDEFANSPLVQVQWGINYIKHRYGTPCEALRFHLRNGWY